MNAGADKVSVNSAAVKNPQLLKEAALNFGSQCIVLAVDVKHTRGRWKVFIGGGRIETEKDGLEWIKLGEEMGVGEILLTSMDCDGTQGGYDLDLLCKVSELVRIPVIASGGAGHPRHLLEAFQKGKADAVLAASIFHYNSYSVGEVKRYLAREGVPIRI